MKKNRMLTVTILASAAVLTLGGLIAWLPSPGPEPVSEELVSEPPADPHSRPGQHAVQARKAEIDARFSQAVLMLHAEQYDYAVKSLHRVLELAPRMPEAHVNMGFALLGGGDARAAVDFFHSAIELNPRQHNAYYGLAVAAEALGDIEVALGAMRTYVHLSQPDDPYLAKARAALWEWEDKREKIRENMEEKTADDQ